MKRFIISLAACISAAILLVSLFLWLMSRNFHVALIATPQTTRYEVSVAKGRLIVATLSGWIWHEPLELLVFPLSDESASSIDDWNGVHAKSHYGWIGFEAATGEYVSPFRPAPPGHPGGPKLMLMTTTEFRAVCIPFWMICLLTIPVPAWHLFRKPPKPAF